MFHLHFSSPATTRRAVVALLAAPLATLLAALAATLASAQPLPLRKLPAAELDAHMARDAQSILTYRAGLAHTVAWPATRPEWFPDQPVEKRLLNDEAKNAARQLWRTHLDYHLALDAIEKRYAAFWQLKARPMRERALSLHQTAHAAKYRYALDFIERMHNDPELIKVFDEPMGELGLPAGGFSRFRFEHLNAVIGSQFVALGVLASAMNHQPRAELVNALSADRERLWQMGRGKGTAMTAANALTVVKNVSLKAVFPVQAGVSEWMGNTRLTRHDAAMISPRQIVELVNVMQPGDVMLQRREWYVSNVGLPGFWSHAALYIGSAAERRAFFDDPEVRGWVKAKGIASGEFDDLIATLFPKAAAAARTNAADGHTARVLEAISEGVSFTSMEHSAAADSLVVLRPKLSKRDRAFALLRAFGYAGRPYDFDFDFQTDAALVCTELIYKAYEPAPGFAGIAMKPTEIAGRLAVPANDIAREFDAALAANNAPWAFVRFIDGIARGNSARESTLEEFRKSWQRPKWHILLPDKAAAR
jgi:hypothetical protein